MGHTGRPTKLTPAVVTKLTAAFHRGYNDEEAADYAGISRQTLYRWLNENQDFCDKISAAKLKPNLKAKEVVIDAIDEGDVQAARWWLERRAKTEFGTRSELAIDEAVTVKLDTDAVLADLDDLIEWRQYNRELRNREA